MERQNVLVLEAGGGPSVSTIKLLKATEPVRVIAAESDPNAPGLYLAEIGIIIPPFRHTEYASAVQQLINDYDIELVLPTFEYGHEKLQTLNGNFATDFSSAILCKDKFSFAQVAASRGIPVPKTELLTNSTQSSAYPLYVKPRFGSGTINNHVVQNGEHLELLRRFAQQGDELVVQEYLTGEHWNVDVLVDNGQFLRAIPRKDISQRGGMCVIVEVRDYSALIDFSRVVQEQLSIKSVFNLEVFEVKPGQFMINEINVRFGGGVIFGALAGCNIVSYLVSHNAGYLGQLREGVYSRYYEEVLATPNTLKDYSIMKALV